MTHFIAIFTLLSWSRMQPTVSPKYAYNWHCVESSEGYCFDKSKLAWG